MQTRFRQCLAALALSVAILGCQRESRSQGKGNASAHGRASSSARASSSEHTPIPPAPQAPLLAVASHLGAHPATPEELLTEWTRALNASDHAALRRLYSDRVKFYGVSLGRDQVLEHKRRALTATPTFQQTIIDKPSVIRKDEVIRIAFHKRSGPKDAQSDALATLVLSDEPRLLIQEETDAATQKRYGAFTPRIAVPKDCASAAWQLVNSTAEAARLYEQIAKNLKRFAAATNLRPGGIGPFTPADTGDGTYDLAVGVHHPERFESYGWFKIRPDGKVTLYSWVLERTDAPVSPSSDALRHFERLCPRE